MTNNRAHRTRLARALAAVANIAQTAPAPVIAAAGILPQRSF